MLLRRWLSRVSHTATSGTLVTPSVMMMIPVGKKAPFQSTTPCILDQTPLHPPMHVLALFTISHHNLIMKCCIAELLP